jgi:predicted nucleotide-binding protein
VRPQKNDLKMPSDLLGVTPIYYDARSSKTLKEKVVPVCNELSIEFARLGVK